MGCWDCGVKNYLLARLCHLRCLLKQISWCSQWLPTRPRCASGTGPRLRAGPGAPVQTRGFLGTGTRRRTLGSRLPGGAGVLAQEKALLAREDAAKTALPLLFWAAAPRPFGPPFVFLSLERALLRKPLPAFAGWTPRVLLAATKSESVSYSEATGWRHEANAKLVFAPCWEDALRRSGLLKEEEKNGGQAFSFDKHPFMRNAAAQRTFNERP